MDNYAILSRGGKQRNLRASRQLLPFNDKIFAGPFSIEIVEPFKTLHMRLDKNETDVEYDLTWHGSVPPALEGNHFEVSRGRVTHQISRYVQTGQVSGTIRCGDEQIEVTPDQWWGVRDHSWGIRPMSGGQGEPLQPPCNGTSWHFVRSAFPLSRCISICSNRSASAQPISPRRSCVPKDRVNSTMRSAKCRTISAGASRPRPRP